VGTRRVLPVPNCRAHHPAISAALPRLQAVLDALGVEPYPHGAGKASEPGSLRHVQLTVERMSGLVQLVLIWDADTLAEVPLLMPLARRLWGCNGASGDSASPGQRQWHSIWAHFRSRGAGDGGIFARESPEGRGEEGRWLLLHGPSDVTELIDGLPFRFSPMVFRQANLEVFEAILRDMKVALGPRPPMAPPPRILELHAGAGVLGLSLLSAAGPGARLLSTDLNPHGAAPFAANAEAVLGAWAPADTGKPMLGIGSPAAFHAASAEDAVALAETGRFDVVVADPPRRGLGRDVVARLGASASVATVVLLSCSPRRFCDEAGGLLAGGFCLSTLRLYDSFPATDHAEVLGVFRRSTSVRHWSRQLR